MASEVDTSSGVAGRYATALFELAKDGHSLDAVASDLTRFNEALDAFDDLKRLMKKSGVLRRGAEPRARGRPR